MAEIVKKDRKSNPARGSKPGEKRGGRGKGTPNKVNGLSKASHRSGGRRTRGGLIVLIAWAKEEPANEAHILWGNIYPKLLPLQISGDPDSPVNHPNPEIPLMAAKQD